MLILKNQKGVSLVQVLIAAALMGGLALVLAKMGQNQSKLQRGAYESMDAISLRQQIQSTLQDTQACTNTLRCIQISPQQQNVEITNIRSRDNIIKFEADQTYGSTTIESMNLTREGTDPRDVVIEVHLSKPGLGFGGKTRTERFPITANFSEDNIIASCAPSAGDNNALRALVCNNMEDLYFQKAINGLIAPDTWWPTDQDAENGEAALICNKRYRVTKVAQTIDANNGQWLAPATLLDGGNRVGTNITFNLLGAGGGGGAGDELFSGRKGGPGEKVTNEQISLASGDSCAIIIGVGGNGGTSAEASNGQATTVNCNGTQIQASGGDFGVGAATGENGQSSSNVTFKSTIFYGSSGGGQFTNNYNYEAEGSSPWHGADAGTNRGVGGGGGGKNPGSYGGKGGNGLVVIEYFTVEIEDFVFTGPTSCDQDQEETSDSENSSSTTEEPLSDFSDGTSDGGGSSTTEEPISDFEDGSSDGDDSGDGDTSGVTAGGGPGGTDGEIMMN